MKWTNILIILLIYFLSSISAVHAKIRVGTVHFDPPYVFSLDQGFEMQLIRLVCHQMKETCDIIPMEYFSLFTNLKNDTIDIAIDSIPFYISSNASNSEYIYSYPYLLSKGQFLILKNNPTNSIQNLAKGSRVGLVRESMVPNEGVFYDFFATNYGSAFQIVLFNDIESLIANLSNGAVSAAFIDNNEAKYWMLKGVDKFKTLGKTMKVADGIGIMALPKNQPLINQINRQLREIEDGKEYINLYNIYFN